MSSPVFAELDGDRVFAVSGSFESGFERAETLGTMDEIQLHAPLVPGKIVCVGLNYLAHVTENDPSRPVPEEPVLFMKPPSAVIGPDEPIQIANPANRTDYEAELAVVIGRYTHAISPSRARDHIFGFTCANDVSDRVLQKKDGQWVRAKGYDTYCPVGPWIETRLDLDAAVVQSAVNGEIRQTQSVSSMIFPVPDLVSFVSHVMTLNPGDLLLTGTPEGVGPLEDGDQVTISVTGIGSLVNTVLA